MWSLCHWFATELPQSGVFINLQCMTDLPDHKNLHLSHLTKSFKALVVAETRIFDDF